MTDQNTKLSTLADLSGRSATLVPEMSNTLSLLVKDLTSLVRLDLPRDRRLLTVDLDNLIEGLGRIIKIRAEGLDPEELEMAVVDMTALAADMRARAAKAIRNEAGEIAIHASVASMRADRTIEPQDLTREFRLIAAVPQPVHSDAPGIIVNTPDIGDENAFGRITGDFLAAAPTHHQAAAYGANVLPVGSIARFEDGDCIAVFVEGSNTGGRFEKPEKQSVGKKILIESGPKGFTLHGPAVLAIMDSPKGELRLLNEYVVQTRKSVKDLDVQRKNIEASSVMSSTIGGGMMGMLLVAAEGLASSAPIAQTLVVALIFGALSAGVGGVVGWPIAAVRTKQARKQAFLNTPEVVRSAAAPEAARAFMSRHGLSSRSGPGQDFPGQCVEFPYGMPDIHVLTSMNILPAQKIEAAANGEVNVMKLLPALPAPSPADVVMPFTSLEKART